MSFCCLNPYIYYTPTQVKSANASCTLNDSRVSWPKRWRERHSLNFCLTPVVREEEQGVIFTIREWSSGEGQRASRIRGCNSFSLALSLKRDRYGWRRSSVCRPRPWTQVSPYFSSHSQNSQFPAWWKSRVRSFSSAPSESSTSSHSWAITKQLWFWASCL